MHESLETKTKTPIPHYVYIFLSILFTALVLYTFIMVWGKEELKWDRENELTIFSFKLTNVVFLIS